MNADGVATFRIQMPNDGQAVAADRRVDSNEFGDKDKVRCISGTVDLNPSCSTWNTKYAIRSMLL